MASSIPIAEAVAALIKKTNKMEQDIQGLSSRVDALENSNSGMQQEIDGLNSRVDALENLNSRVDALENSNSGMQQEIDDLNSRVDALANCQSNTTSPTTGIIKEYQAEYTETLGEYTETFGDFLLNNGGDEYLYRVLANYPAFVVGDVIIDFVPLFKNRNFYKQIGSETEEFFSHNLERLADEIYTRNAIRINAYLAQADRFTQRSIDDTDTTTDYAYLNPVDAPAVINNQAKLAGATKRTSDFKVWLGGNKSNAELVKEIADLYALYNDMLDSFDILFLGVH